VAFAACGDAADSSVPAMSSRMKEGDLERAERRRGVSSICVSVCGAAAASLILSRGCQGVVLLVFQTFTASSREWAMPPFNCSHFAELYREHFENCDYLLKERITVLPHSAY
jgi:hypothetical protein